MSRRNHISATSVEFSNLRMEVELNDGQRVNVPLGAFPLLYRATQAQRDNWILTDDGSCLSWPEIGQNITLDKIYLASDSMTGRLTRYA
ncbi:MAG: DUF2442 domain-containing protein [Desulfovibrio sp.]|nr:DUF2442 domain-containing protein [Desulfovibrio sp.]